MIATLWTSLLLLPTRIKLWLGIGAGFSIALLMAFFKGRSAGQKAYREKRERAKRRAAERTEKIIERNRKIPDSDLDRRLSKWMRDQSDL